MTVALGAEWLDELTRRVNATGLVPSMRGRVGCTVSGGSDGEAVWSWELVDGELSPAQLGPVVDADLAVTATLDDALAIVEGSLDASVAFMQGRLKSTGDTGLLLELLAAASRGRAGGR